MHRQCPGWLRRTEPPALGRVARQQGGAECPECPARDRRVHWCSCVNLATTGSIDKVGGISCFHEKISMKEADRVASELYAEACPACLDKFY